MGIVVALVLTLLIAAAPTPADATGIKITETNSAPRRADVDRGPASIHLDPRTLYPDPRTLYPDPRTLYRDPAALYRSSTGIHHRPDRVHRRHDGHRHDGVHRAPVIVVPQPVVVVTPRRCHEPGYWAYSWVPQNYVSNVWVPGYYDSDALWIEGHYEPRAYAWGYYQPYWVPERWTHC